MRGSLPCIRRQQIINEFCYFLFFFKGLRGCAAELSIKAEAGHFLTYTHLEVNKKAFHTKWSLPSENSCSTSSHYAAATETDHIKETALLKVGGWGRGLCTVLRIQYGTNHRGLFSLVFLRHDLICSREPCCYSLSNPSHVWLFRHRVCRQLQKGFFFYKHLKSSGTLTIICLFLAVRILRWKQETKTSDVATDRDWTDILKMTKVASLVWNKKKKVCQHWSIGEPAW